MVAVALLLAGLALWLVWAAVVEPRRLEVHVYRLRLHPGAAPVPRPLPLPPAAHPHTGRHPAARPLGRPGPGDQEGAVDGPQGMKAMGQCGATGRPATGDHPAAHPAAGPAGGSLASTPGGPSPGPGRGVLRIAHLTDLHAPVYRIREEALFRWLEALAPDLVVFTGDLAEGRHLPAARGVDLLRRLARRWPVYLVPGNHDHLYGWRRLEEELAPTGVQILVNRGTTLWAGDVPVYLAGVDDPHTGRDRLDDALAAAPAGVPVVLLAHAPAAGLRARAAGGRVDLVLAGHTHGGQVRLPGLGALWIPGQGWFPRYDRGWFDIGGTRWYISAGLGTPRPWIRWLCPPELVLLEIEVPPRGTPGPSRP